jgi:hypothetical protein
VPGLFQCDQSGVAIFQATEAEVVVRKFMLAAGELSEKEFAAWLKENSRRA